MGLDKALAVVVAGFVTGATAAAVMLAWALRHTGDPQLQGRRAVTYIVASTLVVLSAVWWIFFVLV